VSEERKDPFEGVVWNHEHFDWSDPTLDADGITSILIGEFWYWELPEYDALSELEIERKILFDAKRPNWGGKSRHGKPYFQHMLALIKLMFPDTDITPSLADAVMLFCMGIGGAGRKILNLIGSQNSGKSAAAVRIAFAIMYIDPEYSTVFVANPFDNAADSTVWGDVEELWDQLKTHFPDAKGDACTLFPKGVLYAAKKLDLVPGLPKAGSIVLRNTKHVGKFKGSKARGKDVDRGVMLLVVDEVNEIESMAFLTTLTNITSQEAFFSVTSQNFKDPEDMGGRLTEPKAIFGGPATFEDLDIERDHFWHSASSSVTLRFDGHKSPNILAGRTIYPKLFKESDRIRLRDDYGEQSPDYFSQARSFPVRGDGTNSVLSRAQISSSRHDDTFFTMQRITGRVSFADPAFGGRDKAVWGCAEFGPAVVTDGNGMEQDTELLVFKEHFRTLQLVKGAYYNDFWFDRMKAVGIDTSDFPEGSDVSYEEQIAIQCVELNMARGIPTHHFGYDFSMRPDIVSAVNRIMGFGAVAFDYNQGPEGVQLQRFKLNSEDCCKNRITELAFLASDVFITRQARGGNNLATALTQLSRTRYETVNKKYVAEGKKEYKARWNNVSPDHRDVLMGITGMAIRRGFRQNTVAAGARPASASGMWQKLNAGGPGRGKVFKRR
jgi:hypothetical protein